MPFSNTIPNRAATENDEPLFLDEPDTPPPPRQRQAVDVGTLFIDEPLSEIPPSSWSRPPESEGRRLPLVLLVMLAIALGFALVAALLV